MTKTYLGATCFKCGQNEWYIACNRCAPCRREASKRYFLAHRQEVLAANLVRTRAIDKDLKKEKQRQYYLANKEKFAKYRRLQLDRIKERPAGDRQR